MEKWLGSALQQYWPSMQQHGFDSVDILKTLSNEQLQEMFKLIGMKKVGHQFHLKNRIAEARGEPVAPAELFPGNQPSSASTGSSTSGTQQREGTRGESNSTDYSTVFRALKQHNTATPNATASKKTSGAGGKYASSSPFVSGGARKIRLLFDEDAGQRDTEDGSLFAPNVSSTTTPSGGKTTPTLRGGGSNGGSSSGTGTVSGALFVDGEMRDPAVGREGDDTFGGSTTRTNTRSQVAPNITTTTGVRSDSRATRTVSSMSTGSTNSSQQRTAAAGGRRPGGGGTITSTTAVSSASARARERGTLLASSPTSSTGMTRESEQLRGQQQPQLLYSPPPQTQNVNQQQGWLQTPPPQAPGAGRFMSPNLSVGATGKGATPPVHAQEQLEELHSVAPYKKLIAMLKDGDETPPPSLLPPRAPATAAAIINPGAQQPAIVRGTDGSSTPSTPVDNAPTTGTQPLGVGIRGTVATVVNGNGTTDAAIGSKDSAVVGTGEVIEPPSGSGAAP